MNPKAQELIDKKISEERKRELQKRNEYLLSLGLVDENNIEKIYINTEVVGAKIDKETNRYYIEKYNAIKVTDEEYKEICKHFPEQTYNKETQQINNSYKEPIQTKQETPNYKEDIIRLRDDVISIKFWVKFWSILTIVISIIAVIVLIVD